MKKYICLLPLTALTGCASYLMPSAAQLKALATDTNSVHVQINTIYGTVQFDRNMNGVVTVPTTFQVRPTQ